MNREFSDHSGIVMGEFTHHYGSLKLGSLNESHRWENSPIGDHSVNSQGGKKSKIPLKSKRRLTDVGNGRTTGNHGTNHRRNNRSAKTLHRECGIAQASLSGIHSILCGSQEGKPKAPSKRVWSSGANHLQFIERQWFSTWNGKNNPTRRNNKKLLDSLSFCLDILLDSLSIYSRRFLGWT